MAREAEFGLTPIVNQPFKLIVNKFVQTDLMTINHHPNVASSLDPSDWKSLRAQGHRMLDDILDYVEHIRERPVWQPIPDGVRAHFHEAVPTSPSDLGTVHSEFMRYILPFAT